MENISKYGRVRVIAEYILTGKGNRRYLPLCYTLVKDVFLFKNLRVIKHEIPTTAPGDL